MMVSNLQIMYIITISKSKSKCVYVYSGNSTILVLDNRRWGADSTSTSFPPVPGAHSCGWPGQMFSAPICTVPRMAYAAIDGNRLSKHGPLCSQIMPRPGSHLGHRAIRGTQHSVCCFKKRRESYAIVIKHVQQDEI